jgi:hypothetical protein
MAFTPNDKGPMMEERLTERPRTAVTAAHGPQTEWRDLREWLSLIERNGLLQRID